MKIVRKIVKWFLYFLILPISYIIISLLLTYITVNDNDNDSKQDKLVYLSTNGVHLDIIIPTDALDARLKKGLVFTGNEKYVSFGWGDENFYVNTPTWGDLTFGNAFSAFF